MVEPFARIQEERTAQLTMATKFRHKLLQRLHGVVARWNCIIFVPNMIGIGESYFPSHLIHKYPGWRVVIKTRIIFGDILPWVYQQSLHYTMTRLGIQLVHINYWEWRRLSEELAAICVQLYAKTHKQNDGMNSLYLGIRSQHYLWHFDNIQNANSFDLCETETHYS